MFYFQFRSRFLDAKLSSIDIRLNTAIKYDKITTFGVYEDEDIYDKNGKYECTYRYAEKFRKITYVLKGEYSGADNYLKYIMFGYQSTAGQNKRVLIVKPDVDSIDPSKVTKDKEITHNLKDGIMYKYRSVNYALFYKYDYVIKSHQVMFNMEMLIFSLGCVYDISKDRFFLNLGFSMNQDFDYLFLNI